MERSRQTGRFQMWFRDRDFFDAYQTEISMLEPICGFTDNSMAAASIMPTIWSPVEEAWSRELLNMATPYALCVLMVDIAIDNAAMSI